MGYNLSKIYFGNYGSYILRVLILLTKELYIFTIMEFKFIIINIVLNYTRYNLQEPFYSVFGHVKIIMAIYLY